MNREIKFRGKMIPEQVWIYGTLLRIPAPPTCFGKKEEDKYYIQFADPNYTPDWDMPYRMVQGQVDNNTIGQFTGLHDKNGKEVYEGDILKFSDVDTAIVQWDKEYASFIAKPVEDFYFDNDVLGCAMGNNGAVEVIGNIYENSELLGGE